MPHPRLGLQVLDFLVSLIPLAFWVEQVWIVLVAREVELLGTRIKQTLILITVFSRHF